jgi:uncharacterized protein YigA (DUF484 family)
MNPDDVETFLRDHPDFLQNRPALLAALNLPHGGQGAVSLVERQVAVLRERSITSRQKLAELSDIGKENERLLKATRDTILALLSAETKADVETIWQQQVVNAFAAELGSLVWFDPDKQDDPRQSVAQKLLAGGDTVSGVLRPEEMAVLFPSVTCEGSVAMSCIRRQQEIVGIIAVGATNTQRYQAEDGTLFLDYLAEVIGQLPVWS